MKKSLLAALVSMSFVCESLFSPYLMASPLNNLTYATTSSTTLNTLNDTSNANFSWDNTTVYFVITDRFVNGNTSNDNSYGRVKTDSWGKNIGTFHGGDIAGLTQKLNDGYFENLGVNTIWLTAPYEQAHGFVGGGSEGDFAHYSYHGYYPLDYTMMDKNMGTIEEMRKFVDTAHEKGIRVVLDVVMNHVGYLTLQDMADYNINPTNTSLSNLANWRPNKNAGETWHSYHSTLLDYDGHASEWAKWWSSGWIRAGVAGYTAGDGSDTKQNLSGLPDVKTEVTSNQGLAPILKTKWAKEQSGYDAWILPAAKNLRRDLGISPSDYQVKWLAAWVKEFGIDGFRVDTAKHVDMFRWAQLKDACTEALQEWRQNNPNKPGADWDEDFWTTAEVFDHGANKSNYHTSGKFDSVINFCFPKNGNIGAIDSTYQSYANSINGSDDWNVLSYISSHDKGLARGNMIDLGSTLLLSPGGIQIFYGDETNRPAGECGSDKDQGSRSDMNWSNMDKSTLTHWQKIGQFRNNHIAVGAGSHTKLNASPYTFQRSYHKNGIDDDVIIVLGASGPTTINVSSVFADNSVVRDAYTGATATIQNGNVTITPDANGVILLELKEVSPLPKIAISPTSSTTPKKYYTDSLEVTVTLKDSLYGAYRINNGAWVPFQDKAVITLDKDLPLETTTKIDVKSSNDYGTVEQSASYLKTVIKPATVHFYKPAAWSTPYVYYYTDDESTNTVKWPGVQMTDEGGNWYSFTTSDLESAYFIFNDQKNQVPGVDEEGFNISDEQWYKNGTWTPIKPPTQTPPTVKEGELKLFMYKPINWGTNLNAYVYNENSSDVATIASWPGVQMNNEGDDLYSITLDKKWLNSKVIFNDGQNQYPAKTGLTVDASRGYIDGSWELCPVEQDNTLSLSISPENTTFSDTLTLTLNAKNATSATYQINDGEEIPYTDGEEIVIGEDATDNEAITVTLNVTKDTDTRSETYTYTKIPNTSLKAYFDNSTFNWSNLHAYIYTETASGVDMVEAWPGVSMNYEGNDIYSYELPEGWENARVIFNNGGSNQYPEASQPGLELTKETPAMIYQNGDWITYEGTVIPDSKKFYFDNSTYNWSTVKAYIYDESNGNVMQIQNWPGTEMTNEGNNIYSYTFTKDWNDPKVIFTNGSIQIPAQGQTGFSLENNMILENGIWTNFNK